MKILERLNRKLHLLWLHIKIPWQYRKELSNQRKAINLVEKTLGSLTWNQGDSFSMLCISMSALVLTKMRSIYTLSKTGLAKDAVIILRVLFEDMMNFNYMHADKTRIQDFMDYDSYQRLKIGRILDPNHPAVDIQKIEQIKHREKELQSLWNQVKHKYTYTDKCGKKKVFKTWSGKNLEEVSRALKHEVSYDYLYRYLSSYVHLNSITFNDYILGRGKKGVAVEVGLSEQYIYEVLGSASILAVEVFVRVINNEYSLDLDKQIEALSKRITKKDKNPR